MLQACNFIKNKLQQRCFPVNIAKSLRAVFFIKHFRWLLLRFTSTFRNYYWKNRWITVKKDHVHCTPKWTMFVLQLSRRQLAFHIQCKMLFIIPPWYRRYMTKWNSSSQLQIKKIMKKKHVEKLLGMLQVVNKTLSLLLTFSIFHVLFLGFCCWLWVFVCWVKYFKDLKNISGYSNTYSMSTTETLENNNQNIIRT